MPLEVAVARLLPKLRMLPKGRYFYEVGTETRETDVWALGGETIGPNSIGHAWFIECKQREGAKHWCFFPQSENVRDLSRNAYIFSILEARDGLNPGLLRKAEKKYFPSLPVVGDGTELFQNQSGNWDANPQAIANGIREAVMPIADHLAWPLHRNLVLDYSGQEVELYLPVVVTTAAIQVLRDDADWDRLTKFQSLEECFDRQPAVISAFSTPGYVDRYWDERVTGHLTTIERMYPDIFEKRAILKSSGSRSEAIRKITVELTTNMPTRVLIVEMSALENTLRDYLNAVNEAVFKGIAAPESKEGSSPQ